MLPTPLWDVILHVTFPIPKVLVFHKKRNILKNTIISTITNTIVILIVFVIVLAIVFLNLPLRPIVSTITNTSVILIVYQKRDLVKQHMKSISFVPKTIPGVGWVGVGWVMQGWCGWGRVGWVCHAGVGWVIHAGVEWGGSCRVSNPADQNQICMVSNLSTNIRVQELQGTESRHATGY